MASRSNTIVKEVIWVTGASSGIGRELALQLVALGNTVIATGRNQQALQQLADDSGSKGAGGSSSGGKMVPLAADVTAADSVADMRSGLQQISARLDRVILNAGNCEYFDIDNPDWSMMRRIAEVNYFGAINCLEAALPLLGNTRLQRGHVIAMGSQASRAAFPKAQAYGASKAALTYFMQSMAIDLRQQGIDVTIVQPGFVDTPLTRKNDFSMPFLMTAEKAAELIIRRLQKRPLLFGFPRRLSAMLSVAEWAPQFWIRRIAPYMTRT